VRALSRKDLVRGQVRGYTGEEGVAKGSTTETFAVLRFFIDSPRWEGVPFYVRTGKSLPLTATEATIRWKRGSCCILDETSSIAPNHVRFRIGPDNVIALGANVKKDGERMVGERAELVLRRSPADEMKPYERLIGDALDGASSLFADQDAVEQSWRVVDPIVGEKEVFPYEPGTWGPAEAARIQPEGGWADPK
jgi:glucose-6-phosphate 1-dehydrogenase